jgi:DNA modification methylase
MIHILNGDSLDLLKQLPGNSVNTIITSPPYYQLRDYGTAKWEGGNPDCKHEYQSGGRNPENSGLQLTNGGTLFTQYRDVCKDCGAKRIDKQIGLEETPSQYITKLVEIFHEAKRVLRNDGTMWVNIGDSYNGSGKASSSGGKGEHSLLQQKNTGSLSITKPCNIKGIKKKDLIGIPWMLAFALRDDGWYLRQDIIWHKPSPMPESVDDRCTRAHEYVFLLSKKSKYYYDQDAIKEPVKSSSINRLTQRNISNQNGSDRSQSKSNGNMKAVGDLHNKNKRSVWKIAQVSYPSVHFATYPPKLIEPMILAGCPEGGIVLDPFGGAGTTAVVSDRLNRSCISIDVSDKYCNIQYNRILNEIGLYVMDTENYVLVSKGVPPQLLGKPILP